MTSFRDVGAAAGGHEYYVDHGRRELLGVRSARPGGAMTAQRGQAGFTLIELLVSMSIVTVVVMATISAFVSFHKNERVNRLQNESQDEARAHHRAPVEPAAQPRQPERHTSQGGGEGRALRPRLPHRGRRQARRLAERAQHQARALLRRARRRRQGAAHPPAADLAGDRPAARVLHRGCSERELAATSTVVAERHREHRAGDAAAGVHVHAGPRAPRRHHRDPRRPDGRHEPGARPVGGGPRLAASSCATRTARRSRPAPRPTRATAGRSP